MYLPKDEHRRSSIDLKTEPAGGAIFYSFHIQKDWQQVVTVSPLPNLNPACFAVVAPDWILGSPFLGNNTAYNPTALWNTSPLNSFGTA